MPASCPDHALTAEQHCEEIEKILEHVPGDFCEGEGDSPRDAVKRLADAYEAECDEAAALAKQNDRYEKALREILELSSDRQVGPRDVTWKAKRIARAALSSSVSQEPKR